MTSRSALVALLFVCSCATATAPPVVGLPKNFGVVEEGKLYRGSQPTAEEIEDLRANGVRTIVKLNTADLDMERSKSGELGIRLIEIPLNARAVGTSRDCADVERAYAAMTDPLNWPVYVHCDHGRDRTGFLAGLYRQRVQGWTYEQVSEELARYGHDRKMRAIFPNITRALADRYQICAAAR